MAEAKIEPAGGSSPERRMCRPPHRGGNTLAHFPRLRLIWSNASFIAMPSWCWLRRVEGIKNASSDGRVVRWWNAAASGWAWHDPNGMSAALLFRGRHTRAVAEDPRTIILVTIERCPAGKAGLAARRSDGSPGAKGNHQSP